MNRFDQFKHFLIRLFYPKRCPYCGTVIENEHTICTECEETLPRIEPPLCSVCGLGTAYCNCTKKYKFRRCAAPFYYEGRARMGIWRLKFQGKLESAQAMAQEMAGVVRTQYGKSLFDLIVYVPMSVKARRQRGFNQAEILALALAKELELPLAEDVLIKRKDNMPQHVIGARERWGNVFGVFSVRDEELVKGKNILLVDDIMTTGATLNECAGILKQAGGHEVYCVVFASTRSKKLMKSEKVAIESVRKRETPVTSVEIRRNYAGSRSRD